MSDVEIRGADAIPEADDSEQARLSHRLEAVGQLAAGIAHEINTPLQFVGDSVKFLNEAVEERGDAHRPQRGTRDDAYGLPQRVQARRRAAARAGRAAARH